MTNWRQILSWQINREDLPSTKNAMETFYKGESIMNWRKVLSWNVPSPGQTWYGIVQAHDRVERWIKFVKMNFVDNEELVIIAAMLGFAGYFSVNEAVEDYNEYIRYKQAGDQKEADEYISFKGEAEESLFIEGEVIYAYGEEWMVGVGRSKDLATKSFQAAEQVFTEDENPNGWDDD